MPSDIGRFSYLQADVVSFPPYFLVDAHVSPDAGIERSKLAQLPFDVFPVKTTDLRVWNATASPLPNSAGGADDLYIADGTWLTHAPTVKSDDANKANITQYAYFEVVLPSNYDSGQTVQIRIPAKMLVVSDTTATVDIEVTLDNGNGGAAVDLCATAGPVSINSATWANKDFDITATSLVPGSVLLCRVAVSIHDVATASGVIAQLGRIALLCDTRG